MMMAMMGAITVMVAMIAMVAIVATVVGRSHPSPHGGGEYVIVTLNESRPLLIKASACCEQREPDP